MMVTVFTGIGGPAAPAPVLAQGCPSDPHSRSPGPPSGPVLLGESTPSPVAVSI